MRAGVRRDTEGSAGSPLQHDGLKAKDPARRELLVREGKGDKVEEGVEFIIYRGGDYIVKVRADRVMNDMVSCRVIQDSWNTKGLKIQQNDLASNRL